MVLFLLHSWNGQACDEEIQNLILENLPEHTFIPTTRKLESRSEVLEEEDRVNLATLSLADEKIKDIAAALITDPYRKKLKYLT